MNYICVKRISQILRHALQVFFRKALCAIDGSFGDWWMGQLQLPAHEFLPQLHIR